MLQTYMRSLLFFLQKLNPNLFCFYMYLKMFAALTVYISIGKPSSVMQFPHGGGLIKLVKIYHKSFANGCSELGSVGNNKQMPNVFANHGMGSGYLQDCLSLKISACPTKLNRLGTVPDSFQEILPCKESLEVCLFCAFFWPYLETFPQQFNRYPPFKPFRRPSRSGFLLRHWNRIE